MRQLAGVFCIGIGLLAGTLCAGEQPAALLEKSPLPTSDPLGLRLVRLCRDQVLQPMAEQIRLEMQRHYSPRHLEQLLAGGDVETRRAAALGIGLVGDTYSQFAVATALHDPDLEVCRRAEAASWQVWMRLGTQDQQTRLVRVQELIRAQELHDAVAQVSLLIQTSPEYAEAWNQRALTYYQMQRYRDAIPDCHRALQLNPLHFGASSGLAQCHMRLNELPQALDAFQLTVKLHPNMPGLKEQISVLTTMVKAP
ncbi:MAG: tetratricopeptide repeat protein [Planctomycetota bacterium]